MCEKVLVTGSDGFLASHLLKELEARGYSVRRFDIYSNPFEDIRDPWAVMRAVKGCKKIIHTCASPYIPACYTDPYSFFDVNAVGTLNLLLAAKQCDVERIIYYSSSEIYGTAQQEKMDESHPLNPQSTYAVSKLAGDRLCSTFYKEHDVPIIIQRQFNCYGEDEKQKYVIPIIIEQLSKGSTLHLGNINAQRDFTYAGDAARASVDLLECEDAVGEVVNVGSGKMWGIDKIAYMVGDIMGVEPKIVIDKDRLRPFDVDRLICDYSKMNKLTGWEAFG